MLSSIKLNLGCGSRFHPAWTNVNFTKTGKGVIIADLTNGIPFSASKYDVVYHSHLLEHFSKTTAPTFLKECYRVLRPNGVLRVVVPDLEAIARKYVFALDQIRAGSLEWAENYEWLLLEMYDQVVRNVSGGEMAAYLLNNHLPNEKFVLERCGIEAIKLIKFGRQKHIVSGLNPIVRMDSWIKKLCRMICIPRNIREACIKLILRDEYEALQIGRFRRMGEVHQWMYDSYSLSKLLMDCGFTEVIERSAKESYLPDWTSYNLDTEPDGSVYKPDSLFMEAIKS